MPERREKLARRRAAMGFTQETLAEHLGLERSTVARWEQGTGTPLAINRPDLAKALDITPDELNHLLDLEPTGVFHPAGHSQMPLVSRSVVGEFIPPDRNAIEPASVVDPPWTVAGALRVLHQLAGGPVDRREFLTITGGTLTGLASQWGSALASAPLPTAPAQADGRLTPEVLDCLDHRLAELRRLDDALGGRDLCQLAVAEFRYLSHLADHAVYDNATGERLFGLITDAAGLCGWLHYDAARHDAAQYYYVAALRSSAIANDPLIGAHILGRMSELANIAGNHQDAINMLEAAEQQTRHLATARAKARIANGKAWANAQAGYSYACGKALNDAERWLEKAGPGTDEPDWLYYVNEAELAYTAGQCWVELRKPKKARPLIDNALASIEPDYVRDTALFHMRSAEAHLHANDLEPACDDLRSAADLARRTGSIRTVELIRSTRLTMSAHANEPRVQDLDGHLASLTA